MSQCKENEGFTNLKRPKKCNKKMSLLCHNIKIVKCKTASNKSKTQLK